MKRKGVGAQEHRSRPPWPRERKPKYLDTRCPCGCTNEAYEIVDLSDSDTMFSWGMNGTKR